MPAITRNKSQMIMKNIISSKSVINQQVIKKVRPDSTNMVDWFKSVIQKSCVEIDQNNTRKAELEKHLKCLDSHFLKPILENELRTLHFDNIRYITELLFFIEQYFPEVSIIYPMPAFAKVIYQKVQELYKQIHDDIYKPKTEDDHKVAVAIISVLKDVEKNIIPLLPSNVPLKRRRNFVDYTGMDTIEPESESDRITNIWDDQTIEEDPDYIPMEDEEDEELYKC